MTKRLIKVEVGLIRSDLQPLPHGRPLVTFDDPELIAKTPYVCLEMDMNLWLIRAKAYYNTCVGYEANLVLSQVTYFYDDNSQMTRIK